MDDATPQELYEAGIADEEGYVSSYDAYDITLDFLFPVPEEPSYAISEEE
jgi:hypothetical protein